MATYWEEKSLCKCCHEKFNLNTTAVSQCQQCNVSFCESCATKHSQGKVTSSHNLVDLKPAKIIPHVKKTYTCDICKSDHNGEAFCRKCILLLCKPCLRQHKIVHSPREITRDNSTSLEICFECKRYGTLTVSDKLCLGCVNNFCQECCNSHKCRNVTGKEGIAFDVPKCEPCEKMTIFTTAKTMCTDCDEFLCCQCSEHHSFSFENHEQKMITFYGKPIKNINLCEICSKSSKEEKATSMCLDCHDKLFCELCAVQHISFKRTKHHKVSFIASSPNFTDNKETQTESIERNDKETETFPYEDSLNLSEFKPGKPEASYIGIDSVTLIWKEAKAFDKSNNYQVSYKETDIQNKWTLYNDSLDLKVSNITVTQLKTNTSYRFRIRVVSTEGEGPYSPVSDKVITRTSCAGMLMSFSKKLQDGNPLPSIYTLPLKEDVDLRNVKAKTKWFEIGESTKGRTSNEKTIIIFGTTDCGKRSVIDSIINYIVGVQWTDTFRFSTRSKELREDIMANWINIFSVRPEQGSRLQYRLNIVEIPPFDISKPLNENLGIVEQIRVLLCSTAPLRLELLDAICFVVKSTDTQLTKFQEIMFQYVLSIFGKDLSSNIFTLLTFTDLKDPPIFEFICETKMPISKTFKLNSSALFEKNVGLEAKATFQMFWQASEESFGKFFEELEKTPSQSLRQTNYLIEQELLFKAIFEKIQKELDKVLKKANELNIEQNKIEQEEDTIKKNENFKIVKDKTISTLTELPSGSYALNCNDCKTTCCPSVDSAHIEIESCDAMDSSGKCKVCVSRCMSKSHVIESGTYVLSTEKVTNIDQIMEDAYRKANTELQRLEHRVQILGGQMNDICDTLKMEADNMNGCRQEIHQNSLWQNVQGLENEIELRIEMLKEERSEGFIDEIRKMKEFRKYIEATKNVHQFTEDARSILKVVGRNRPENAAASTNLAKLTALFKLLHE